MNSPLLLFYWPSAEIEEFLPKESLLVEQYNKQMQNSCCKDES